MGGEFYALVNRFIQVYTLYTMSNKHAILYTKITKKN